MIEIHHLNNSRSQRILWLLEELGQPYKIVPYQRDATTRLAPPELKRVHPLGKSPVIVDDGRVGTRQSFHFLHGLGAKTAPVRASRLDRTQAHRPGFDYADDFHRFAVDWRADGVRHYVDDVLVVDRAFTWAHNDGSDAGPAHVLVNLAVGGHWPGPPDPVALPARLRVAHIRVWQADES